MTDILSAKDARIMASSAVPMFAWLAAKGSTGACMTEFPAEFDSVSTILRRYCMRGQVGYVEEAGDRKRQRRRYFTREHCPSNATLEPLNVPRRAQLAADPNHKPQPRHKQQSLTVMRKAAPVVPFASAEADYSKAKRTVWVPPPDPRAVGKPEPFFAAGERLEARPWAVAVAGGAR